MDTCVHTCCVLPQLEVGVAGNQRQAAVHAAVHNMLSSADDGGRHWAAGHVIT
jgi:hypothetical protein